METSILSALNYLIEVHLSSVPPMRVEHRPR